MEGRTIFVGDVHGCLDELLLLMERLNASSKDRFIFLGDLVGKGPKVQETLQFVKEGRYECLMGNHEWRLLERSKQGALGEQASHHLEWIAELPLYIEAENFTAVHGGIPPTPNNFRDAEPTILLSLRYWKNGEPNAEEGVPWHSLYKGNKLVVYGHWAKQGFWRTQNTIGLDTGCVYGGCLSAYILEADALVQVRARKVYQAHKTND